MLCRFFVEVIRTRDQRLLTINCSNKSSSEVWMIDSMSPLSPPKLVQPRQPGLLYHVEHSDNQLYILGNTSPSQEYEVSSINVRIDRNTWQLCGVGVSTSTNYVQACFDHVMHGHFSSLSDTNGHLLTCMCEVIIQGSGVQQPHSMECYGQKYLCQYWLLCSTCIYIVKKRHKIANSKTHTALTCSLCE